MTNKNSCLTLIGTDQTPPKERKPKMKPISFHAHGAFDDIEAAASFIELGIDAIEGIGFMLQPEMADADEQMNFTRRSNASAVFRFFGEAMKSSIRDINDASFRLSNDLRVLDQGEA